MTIRQSWLLFAAILVATAIVVWGAVRWDDARHANDVDHFVEQLCEGTPDC